MTGHGSARLQGVDAARGLALVGMAATHVLPAEDPDGSRSLVDELVSGRAAATFAVLAGVALALSAGRWDVRGRLALLLRAAAVGALGLALALLDSGVAVILAYYAVLFVLVQPFLTWRPRRLLLLAAGVALVVPVLSQSARALLPERDVANPGPSRLAEPGPLLSELLLTGYYPAAAWLAYVALGLAVGRLALRRPAVCAALAVTGALLLVAAHAVSRLLLGPLGGAAALGPDVERYRGFGNVPTGSRWWLAVDAPHSTTPLDLLATSGAGLLVLGVALLVASRAAGRVGVLLAPLAAAGSMPLTMYTAHVVVLGLTDDGGHPVPYWLLQCAVALGFAVLWRRLVGRGPVEAGLAALTRRVAGRAAARSCEVPGSTLRPPRAWEQS